MVAPLIPLGIQAGRVLLPKALKYAGKAYSAYYYGSAAKSAAQGDFQPLTDAASFKLLNKAPKLLKADVGVIVSKGLGRTGKGPVKVKYPKGKPADSSTVFDRAGKRKIKPNEETFKYSAGKRKQVIGYVKRKDGVYTDRKGNIATHAPNTMGSGSSIKMFQLDPSGRIKKGGTHTRYLGKDYQNKVKDYSAISDKPKADLGVKYMEKRYTDVRSEQQSLNKIASKTVDKLKKLGDKNNRLLVTKGDIDSIGMAVRIKRMADRQGVNTTIVKNPISVKAGKSIATKDKGRYKIEQFNRESAADHGSKFNPVRAEQMDMIRKRSTVGAVFKSKARNRFIVPVRDVVRDKVIKTVDQDGLSDEMLLKTPASAVKSYFKYLTGRLNKNISGPAFGRKGKYYVVGNRTIDKLDSSIIKTTPNKLKRFGKKVESDAIKSVGKGTRINKQAYKKYPHTELDIGKDFKSMKLQKGSIERSDKIDKAIKKILNKKKK